MTYLNWSRFYKGLRYLGQPRKVLGRMTGPKVLLVSVPKSGTHLLLHTLALFPTLRNKGSILGAQEIDILNRISEIKPGQIVRIHERRTDEIDVLLESRNILALFIIRDPRDVCVSRMHYIMRECEHPKHDYYKSLSNNFERLNATITGYEGEYLDDRNIWVGSIDFYFRILLNWIGQPRTLTIKFEDLVGFKGGGDSQAQKKTIMKIARHLRVKLPSENLTYIADNAFSINSATFRRGQIGSWRDELKLEHILKFKEVAGQLLIDLGYESNLDW